MGELKLCESWQIKDNVGLYLFGAQNYQATEGVIAPEVPGGFNLYMLGEMLSDRFSYFDAKVDIIASLYESVMEHAAPLVESRAAHRVLDTSAQDLVDRILIAPGVKDALLRDIELPWHHLIFNKFGGSYGQVPKENVVKFLEGSLGYAPKIKEARSYLENQASLLKGVKTEMDDFRDLTQNIWDDVTSILARSLVVLQIEDKDPYRRACQLVPYVNGAKAMIPKFCKRREDLEKALSSPAKKGVYLCDNLSELKLAI